MSVLALALKRLALSRGTVPSAVPVVQSAGRGTNGTGGTLGTDGTPGTVITVFLAGEPIDTDAFEERAAICEHDGELSREHAEQLAALHAAPLPAGVTEEQRAVVIDAAARFLDRWRKDAAKGGM